MPVITLNLQLNTYHCSWASNRFFLKVEALNDTPFKCLICNYLLKCFLHIGAVHVWIGSSISPGSSSRSHAVCSPSLCLSIFPLFWQYWYFERHNTVDDLAGLWKLLWESPAGWTRPVWSSLLAGSGSTPVAAPRGWSSQRWCQWPLLLLTTVLMEVPEARQDLSPPPLFS